MSWSRGIQPQHRNLHDFAQRSRPTHYTHSGLRFPVSTTASASQLFTSSLRPAESFTISSASLPCEWSRHSKHADCDGFLHVQTSVPSGTASSERLPHMEQTCYGGPELCKPGGSKTYTTPLPRTGLSQAVFSAQNSAECFLDLCNLFSKMCWVMTDDKRQVQPINAR